MLSRANAQYCPDRASSSVIDGLVSSGRYQNASEVLSEGLRLIEQREVREAAKLKALQAAAHRIFRLGRGARR
jgi:putative addiction module CopG family antidote